MDGRIPAWVRCSVDIRTRFVGRADVVVGYDEGDERSPGVIVTVSVRLCVRVFFNIPSTRCSERVDRLG